MLNLKNFSYHYGEDIINTKPQIKLEIETILQNPQSNITSFSRPNFNEILKERFLTNYWKIDNEERNGPQMEYYFIKDRVGVNIRFGHGQFMGTDILRFEVDSIYCKNKIDVGVYIVTTKSFQKGMKEFHNLKWADGALAFERVLKYLPYYNSVIHAPIYVIGIDI